MFGWGDFRGMENIEGKTEWKTLFSTIWEREENRESGKSGRKFSPGPTNFVSPNREEMAEWKTDEEYFVHNALWNQVKKKKKKKKEERQRMRTAPALARSLECY